MVPLATTPCATSIWGKGGAGSAAGGVGDAPPLIWCDAEVRRTYDGGASGQGCGWQDDDVGNNCLAAPPDDPCNGETWLGRCDGDTLVWCADDVVRTAQCQTCGWQDDDIGNNCL